MKDLFNKIRNEVLGMGACDFAPNLIPSAHTIDDMINIMLQPQCIEFCMSHKYPSVDSMKPFEWELAQRGVFLSNTDLNREVPRKILIFDGDVTIRLKNFEVCEIYICGGSVHVTAEDNSMATVENWGGIIMHEGNVKIYKKI